VKFEGTLLGFAKLVVSPEIPNSAFEMATECLELMINREMNQLRQSLLEKKIDELQRRVAQLEQVKIVPLAPMADGSGGYQPGADLERAANGTLLGRVLDILDHDFANPTVSLKTISRAVGVNDKYLAHLFVTRVGERMSAYLRRIRIRHACELLLRTDARIEDVARLSGFGGGPQFRQSFRRHLGVAPSEYRRIFVRPH